MRHSCMDYRDGAPQRFTCPVCGTAWVLAGVAPGAYYEEEMRAAAEETHAARIRQELSVGSE
jgi:hypothetical protein